MLSAPEDRWLDRVKEAHIRLGELRQRLDDAAKEYTEGRISLTMLSNIEQHLTPEIEQAGKVAVPPVTDENLATLLQAADIENAWNRLDLIEQRRLLKMLLDIRIVKAPQLGGKFDTDRIRVAPRFNVSNTYRWRRGDVLEEDRLPDSPLHDPFAVSEATDTLSASN